MSAAAWPSLLEIGGLGIGKSLCGARMLIWREILQKRQTEKLSVFIAGRLT